MWRSGNSLIKQIETQPYRFEFFQLMQILNVWLTSLNGYNSSSDAVSPKLRFISRMDLSFPASEILGVEFERVVEQNSQSDSSYSELDSEVSRVWITPAFMSLLGSNGVLPLHYTEQLISHQVLARDDGPRWMMDMLSNRTLMMFYDAWRKFRMEFQGVRGEGDKFVDILSHLSGQFHLSNPLSNSSPIPQQALAYYSAVLRQRPMSSSLMQSVLNDYFRVPINIIPFHGGWQRVPKEQQLSLGVFQGSLGYDTLLGERVWQRNLCVAIEIGPLRWGEFLRFLPKGKAMRALEEWLSRMTGVSLEYEVRLKLHREDCETICLSQTPSVGLGWNSYLQSSDPIEHRQDVRYLIHASV